MNKDLLLNKDNYGKMPRLEGLQALRMVAFLFVFLSHAELGSLSSLGAFGVSIFIILSGFLMTYNYYYKDVELKVDVHLAWKRIRNLYPLHIFMLIIVMLPAVLKLFRDYSINIITDLFVKIVLNVLLVQVWIPNSKYYFSANSVSWYLSMCFFLYLVYPLILRSIKRYINKKKAIVIIIITFGIQVLSAIAFSYLHGDSWFSQHWLTYIFPLYRLGDFIIGSNVGYLFIHRDKSKNGNKLLYSLIELFAVLLSVEACYIYAKGYTTLGNENIKYTLLFLPISIILVVLFANGSGFVSSLVSNKIFVAAGSITAYAFLVHIVVLEYSRGILGKVGIENRYLVVGFALIVTILISVIYDRIFIKKYNIMKSK